ncbi:hypothetical protein [Nocardia sp. NPDC004722]
MTSPNRPARRAQAAAPLATALIWLATILLPADHRARYRLEWQGTLEEMIAEELPALRFAIDILRWVPVIAFAAHCSTVRQGWKAKSSSSNWVNALAISASFMSMMVASAGVGNLPAAVIASGMFLLAIFAWRTLRSGRAFAPLLWLQVRALGDASDFEFESVPADRR